MRGSTSALALNPASGHVSEYAITCLVVSWWYSGGVLVVFRGLPGGRVRPGRGRVGRLCSLGRRHRDLYGLLGNLRRHSFANPEP